MDEKCRVCGKPFMKGESARIMVVPLGDDDRTFGYVHPACADKLEVEKP